MSTGKMSAITAAKVSILKTDAGVGPQILAHRQGSDLSGPFLFLTAILLLLELLIGNTYLSNPRTLFRTSTP